MNTKNTKEEYEHCTINKNAPRGKTLTPCPIHEPEHYSSAPTTGNTDERDADAGKTMEGFREKIVSIIEKVWRWGNHKVDIRLQKPLANELSIEEAVTQIENLLAAYREEVRGKVKNLPSYQTTHKDNEVGCPMLVRSDVLKLLE